MYRSSSLLLAEKHSIVCTTIHLSIYLGYFQFLATCVSSLNIHVQVFVGTIVFISLGQRPSSEIAGHMVKTMFNFERNQH